MKAFPCEWEEFHPNTTGSSHVSNAQRIKHSEGGMDLRDYFAAKAMHCLVNDWSDIRDDVAQDCYNLADLMLKARAK